MGESHWTTSICLLPELDIIHDCRLLLRWTKGAGLFGTHFIIFVMPLASLLCQPFRFEQSVTGDTGLFFTGINRLHLATL